MLQITEGRMGKVLDTVVKSSLLNYPKSNSYQVILLINALMPENFQDEEEDGSEVEDEESESEVGEERVPTPKNIKDDEDLDTDQETDRLLGQQYNDDNGYYDQKVRNLVKS